MSSDCSIDIDLRSDEEMKEAHQRLADAFHPRRNYGGCDECEDAEFHTWPCRMGASSTFQGWKTSVMTTEKIVPECSKDTCQERASRRVYVNIWGSLYELDLCSAHAEENHMKRRDSI